MLIHTPSIKVVKLISVAFFVFCLTVKLADFLLLTPVILFGKKRNAALLVAIVLVPQTRIIAALV